FRGSENDVLDRYYQAAKEIGADIIVRITGDCPLHDPDVIDGAIERYLETGADHVKQPDNYTEGVDTEDFSFAALERSWKQARLPSDREHVTLFIRNHPEQFKLDSSVLGDFDHSSMHWSVDTAADLEFVTRIFEHFGESTFYMRDVIALLKTRP